MKAKFYAQDLGNGKEWITHEISADDFDDLGDFSDAVFKFWKHNRGRFALVGLLLDYIIVDG